MIQPLKTQVFTLVNSTCFKYFFKLPLLVLVGKYATKDLIHRLPDPEAPNDRVEENTVGAILCAVHQVVNKSIPNAK